MTHDLIPTFEGQLNGLGQPLVNARDLHAFLQVGRDFSNWMKDRIEQYGFVEGEEFSPILAKTSSGLFGGRPRVEYHLSVGMAKELAMIENNAKGRQLRRYFVAVERTLLTEMPAVVRNLEEKLAAARASAMLVADPITARVSRYHDLGLSPAEIGKLCDLSPSATQKRLRRLADLGLVDYRPNPALVESGRKGRALQLA